MKFSTQTSIIFNRIKKIHQGFNNGDQIYFDYRSEIEEFEIACKKKLSASDQFYKLALFAELSSFLNSIIEVDYLTISNYWNHKNYMYSLDKKGEHHVEEEIILLRTSEKKKKFYNKVIKPEIDAYQKMLFELAALKVYKKVTPKKSGANKISCPVNLNLTDPQIVKLFNSEFFSTKGKKFINVSNANVKTFVDLIKKTDAPFTKKIKFQFGLSTRYIVFIFSWLQNKNLIHKNWKTILGDTKSFYSDRGFLLNPHNLNKTYDDHKRKIKKVLKIEKPVNSKMGNKKSELEHEFDELSKELQLIFSTSTKH